ncbi:hypothetical protein B566_EDAN007920 [Ephemera danica]|nr:hypothetical protein B566_EDAN007920 [Ephemera danica]
MESARSFVNGIFGQDESNKVWYPEALTKDPILRFYKLCEKWLTEVDDTPASQQEKLSFEASEPFQTVLRDVAARLGLSEISTDDLVLMYKTCAFETSWMQNGVSPWCVIFSENHLQACPAIQDMLDTFQQADEGSSLKGTFYFTHSGTILKLLSHLGLYRDATSLLHSNFEQYRKHRQWRVGLIDSFATNIAAVLYLCGNDDDYHVLMLHQERVVNLPGCPKDKLCPLDVLRKNFPICNFDKICDLSQTRGFDEL